MSYDDNEIQKVIFIKKKKKSHGEHQHSTAWKIALADFMTTMMILFFILWVVTITPPEKKKELVSFFEGNKATTENGVLKNNSKTEKEDNTSKIYFALSPKLQKIDPSVKMEFSKGRLQIVLDAKVLFDVGKSEIKPQFRKVITKISDMLKSNDVYIDVYGYTDNQPIVNSTNLSLSIKRATSAANALIADGISVDRIGVHGEGERFPIDSNNTETGRAKNRRIVIFITPIHREVSLPSMNKLEKNNSQIPAAEGKANTTDATSVTQTDTVGKTESSEKENL